MKYIQKQIEPVALSQWKQQANENWQPSYESIGHELKNIIKQALIQEQGHICCYCEQKLNPKDSHIEHFQPQEDPSVDNLDFANMLCSCQNQLTKGEPRHCGKLKENWFDPNLLISPLDPHCETAFKFTADGHIQQREVQDLAAVTTIEKLGLNIPKLRDLRAKAFEPFLEPSLSDSELKQFVAGYLSPSPSGEFNPFWSSIRYLFDLE